MTVKYSQNVGLDIGNATDDRAFGRTSIIMSAISSTITANAEREEQASSLRVKH